ncbi:MAG: hypothetical protein ACT4NV_04385 [Rhodoferax sp.]
MFLSNSDDPWIIRSTWGEILQAASAQGRFWLVPINWMAGLPYRIGGFELGALTKMLVNAGTLLAFTAFVARLVNRPFALLCALVWLALTDVSPGYYSPFHGFLLMFNLQMGVLFLSLWWYLGLLAQKRQGLALVPVYALFGFALLAYEPMLFFSATYPAVAWFQHQRGQAPFGTDGWRVGLQTASAWFMRWLRANWGLPLIVALYLATYFIYRSFQPQPGRGLDGLGDLTAIAKTIFRFSVHGFHVGFDPLGARVAGTTPVFTTAYALAYGMCIAIAAWLLLPTVDQRREDALIRHPASLAVLAFFLLSPNLLHGFVEGYRQWAAEDPHYVGNYLSSFALALWGAIALSMLVGGNRARQEPVLWLLVVAVLAASASNNMLRWATLADTNRKDAQLWKNAIRDLRSLPSPNQPLRLCAKGAPEKVSGDDAFWSYQLTRELGYTVIYKSTRIGSAQCDHTIDFHRYRFG